MKFNGTQNYVATEDLKIAVNAAVTLERPLLVKGEPGTGKTELARQIAESLSLPIIEWNIKSTTKAQQGLYEYDAVSRLRDSQLGDERVKNIKNYIKNHISLSLPCHLPSHHQMSAMLTWAGIKIAQSPIVDGSKGVMNFLGWHENR